MKNLTDVARRIRGQDNSEKSRNRVNDYKKRVRELFIKMRPKGTDGKPQHWSSAEVASAVIWEVILDGKDEDGAGIKHGTFCRYCKELYEQDKNSGLTEIEFVVREFSADGEKIIMKI